MGLLFRTCCYTIFSLLCLFALIKADCPPFDPVPLNTMELDSNAAAPVGTVITFRCTLGYEFRTENSAEVNATCQTDDTWTQVNDCQKVLCADLPDDIQKNSTDYSFGSTVDMNCDAFGNTRIPGVPVGESLTVTCQANKTWTDWDDHENGCIEVVCQNPLPNAIATNNDTATGSQTMFTCIDNYFFDIDSNLVFKDLICDAATGEWRDTSGVANWDCIAPECPPLISTFELLHTEVSSEDVIAASAVQLKCGKGHEYNDSSVEKMTICYPNQTWSFEPIDCQPRSCQGIQAVNNANASTTDDWYGISVNFTCHYGFSFPNGDTVRQVTCNEFGRWSERLPHCTNQTFDIETDFKPSQTDAENAELFGTIFFAIFGLLFVGVVIFDILTFSNQLNFLKRNLSSRFKCLQPEDEESEIDSLDGDEIMRQSVFSLGKGRITPAPSTVDIQAADKSKASSLDHVQEEEQNEEESAPDESDKKPIIPRTRLLTARQAIQKAMSKVVGANQFTQSVSVKQKLQFATKSLPLGADNYGKTIEPRPPSPEAEDEEEDSSDYTDESSDEEQ